MSLPPLFRPLLWPTLFTVISLPVLIGLGVWQLQRLEWKTRLIAERTHAFQQLADKTLDQIPERFTPGQRVIFNGHWRHDYETFVEARIHDGKVGIYVVTPFQTNEGTILVNRGWVPGLRKPEAPFSRPIGPFSLHAALLPAETPSRWASPGQDVVYIEPSKILGNLPNTRIDCYAQEISSRKEYPLAPTELPTLPNRHLEYALTWFIFAAMLLAIYGIYVMQVMRGQKPQ